MSDPEPDPHPRWTELLSEFDQRRDEAYGAAVAEYVLKARVERRDLSGAPPGTVDAEVIYPDKRTAALEITSVEPTETWHLRKRIDKMKSKPSPGRLSWFIRPNSVAELDRLVTIHERVIGICERYGVTDPERLPGDVIAHDDDLKWLAWENVMGRMSGHPWPKNPKVFWEQSITSAVWGNDAEAIAEGVTEALKVEPCLKHVAKLLRDAHEERHLFLVVGATGLSNAAAMALIEPEDVPTIDPDLPEGIDHLWLGPGWGSTVTVWSRDRGWRNEQARDEPPRARQRRQ